MRAEVLEIVHRRVDAEIGRRKPQLEREYNALRNRMNSRGMLRSGATGRLIVELCVDELNARGEIIWRVTRDSLARVREPFDKETSEQTRVLLKEKLPANNPELWHYIHQGTRGFPDNAINQLESMFRDAYKNFLERLHSDIDLECIASQSVMVTTASPTLADDFDVFVCHASEDKDDFVRPLAEALKEAGHRVWYDEFTMTWGDRLRRSIEHGLASSKFGIVVLSPYFFEKEWPQRELDGLTTLELDDGRKRILPVWHNIEASGIKQYAPTLGDVIGVPSSKGIEFVVTQLAELIGS